MVFTDQLSASCSLTPRWAALVMALASCMLKELRYVVAFALLAISHGVGAVEGEACSELPTRSQYSDETVDPSECVCGSVLDRQIAATLTGDLRIEAVCDLHLRPQSGGRTPIDLNARSVNFDHVGVGEEYVYGFVLLKGKQRLTGRLSYQPGPSGDLWFQVAGAPIAACNTTLGRELSTLKLIEPSQGLTEAYNVPQSLRDAPCWTADAVIEVESIWLLIGDTDEAGAYPSKHTAISVTKFDTHCTPS